MYHDTFHILLVKKLALNTGKQSVGGLPGTVWFQTDMISAINRGRKASINKKQIKKHPITPWTLNKKLSSNQDVNSTISMQMFTLFIHCRKYLRDAERKFYTLQSFKTTLDAVEAQTNAMKLVTDPEARLKYLMTGRNMTLTV